MKNFEFENAVLAAKEFDSKKDWVGLAEHSRIIEETFPEQAEGWLLHSLALHRLGDNLTAIEKARRGLSISPTSNWGLNLAIVIYRVSCRHSECRDLVDSLINIPTVNTENFENISEYFSEINDWDQAAIYSRKRLSKLMEAGPGHFSTPPSRSALTLVIQGFARTDRIRELLDSLQATEGRSECNLVVCIDSAINCKNPTKYQPGNNELISFIAAKLPELLISYRNVSICLNPTNLGTALTAQRACDLGFMMSDNIVFFEEDCVVAQGALNWFRFGLTKIHHDGDYWFAGGESPFFDSKGKSVPDDIFTEASRVAKIDRIRESYVEENYVPSTCFATKLEVWERARAVRGLPRGAEHISTLLNQKLKRTILPTVPFVKDVGMQDELGYSVAKLGHEGVLENKTVYLMNDSVECDFKISEFDSAFLYMATSNLDYEFLKKIY